MGSLTPFHRLKNSPTQVAFSCLRAPFAPSASDNSRSRRRQHEVRLPTTRSTRYTRSFSSTQLFSETRFQFPFSRTHLHPLFNLHSRNTGTDTNTLQTQTPIHLLPVKLEWNPPSPMVLPSRRYGRTLNYRGELP